MRLLFVTDYFPPHYIGGYELHCARVAEWFVAAGHPVRVLTGDFRLADAGPEIARPGLEVRRDLELRYWTDISDLAYWRRERRDLKVFRRHLSEFRPDVVVVWNMLKLASGIAMEAQRRAPLLVYHLMDEWAAGFRSANGLPQFWSRPARSWWGRALKPPARRIYPIAFTADASAWTPRYAVLTSYALGELMEKNGVRFERTHVSYITYDPALFDSIDWNRENDPPSPVRFLWAGRLCRGKGLFTTLDALDLLSSRRPEGWSVDFCGPVDEEDRARFESRLESAPWKRYVRYLGSLPHSDMPRQYRDHDAFLFTSEVHEGLPGTLVEAFAAGLPVIGTLTGGTKDILRPDENCLVYPMGDAPDLAERIERLIADASLRRSLSSEVARFAFEHCSNTTVFPRLIEFYSSLLEAQQ
ncbi:glycosyltransferase family 4 protein [Candidatus Sumerlaeota bacterium]|nr:glycosyltransferase family 4 protein [Candidatus Sumerlaeota bacterium]